jgi:cell division protein FtsB
MTSKYTKLSLVLLLIILAMLQHRLWFGDNGWRTVKNMEQELTLQQKENDQLRERNHVLEAEVTELKQGLEGVEERARSELGMIKPGEKFYFIVDDNKTPTPTPK